MADGFSLPTRIQTATLNAWLKKIEEPVYHNNPLMAHMRQKGLINYNAENVGGRLNWQVRVFRGKPSPITGEQREASFPVRQRIAQASLGWCGYDMAERLTWLEKKLNVANKNRLYDIHEQILRMGMDDFLYYLGLYMWQDGSIPGNELYGYLSLIGGSSTKTAEGCYNALGTYTPITPADGASSWWACSLDRTYAGLTMNLGNKDSAITVDEDKAFPMGKFSEAYHYWHPIIGDYNSDYFTVDSGETHNWKNQWQQALNAVNTYHAKLHKKPVDLYIIDADLLRQAVDSLEDKQQITVTSSSETKSLGFKSLEYNGIELLPGYGVPDGLVAGFTWDAMQLRLLQSQLVEREEDHDIVSSDDLYKLSSGMQMQFSSPALFPCLVPASSEGT
jgi:hypothetical protein